MCRYVTRILLAAKDRDGGWAPEAAPKKAAPKKDDMTDSLRTGSRFGLTVWGTCLDPPRDLEVVFFCSFRSPLERAQHETIWPVVGPLIGLIVFSAKIRARSV